jgi:hypothetical protein
MNTGLSARFSFLPAEELAKVERAVCAVDRNSVSLIKAPTKPRTNAPLWCKHPCAFAKRLLGISKTRRCWMLQAFLQSSPLHRVVPRCNAFRFGTGLITPCPGNTAAGLGDKSRHGASTQSFVTHRPLLKRYRGGISAGSAEAFCDAA